MAATVSVQAGSAVLGEQQAPNMNSFLEWLNPMNWLPLRGSSTPQTTPPPSIHSIDHVSDGILRLQAELQAQLRDTIHHATFTAGGGIVPTTILQLLHDVQILVEVSKELLAVRETACISANYVEIAQETEAHVPAPVPSMDVVETLGKCEAVDTIATTPCVHNIHEGKILIRGDSHHAPLQYMLDLLHEHDRNISSLRTSCPEAPQVGALATKLQEMMKIVMESINYIKSGTYYADFLRGTPQDGHESEDTAIMLRCPCIAGVDFHDAW
jgi:hypothetical protein